MWVVSTLTAGVKSLSSISLLQQHFYPDKHRKRKLHKILRFQRRKCKIFFIYLSKLTTNHQATDIMRKNSFRFSGEFGNRRKLEGETERNLQELEKQHVEYGHLGQDTDQYWSPFVNTVIDPQFPRSKGNLLKITANNLISFSYGILPPAGSTFLLTYSKVQSPSWAANWFAASHEIPRLSQNPKVHYRTHKRPPPVSILGQPNPVHIPTSHLLDIHPNITYLLTYLLTHLFTYLLNLTYLLT